MSLRSDSGGYYSHYLSGWCSRCGRKRGADGRCADCDGWWTSPLLTVGAPVIGLGATLLLVLLPLLRHHEYTPAYAATSVLSSPASPRVGYRPLRIVMAPSSPAALTPAPVFAVRPAAMPPQTAGFAPSAAAATAAVAVPAFTEAAPSGDSLRRLAEHADGQVSALEARQAAAVWTERHDAALRAAAAAAARAAATLPPQIPAAAVAPSAMSPNAPGTAAPPPPAAAPPMPIPLTPEDESSGANGGDAGAARLL